MAVSGASTAAEHRLARQRLRQGVPTLRWQLVTGEWCPRELARPARMPSKSRLHEHQSGRQFRRSLQMPL
eukprot:3270534-Amphidinium_carterae.1